MRRRALQGCCTTTRCACASQPRVRSRACRRPRATARSPPRRRRAPPHYSPSTRRQQNGALAPDVDLTVCSLTSSDCVAGLDGIESSPASADAEQSGGGAGDGGSMLVSTGSLTWPSCGRRGFADMSGRGSSGAESHVDRGDGRAVRGGSVDGWRRAGGFGWTAGSLASRASWTGGGGATAGELAGTQSFVGASLISLTSGATAASSTGAMPIASSAYSIGLPWRRAGSPAIDMEGSTSSLVSLSQQPHAALEPSAMEPLLAFDFSAAATSHLGVAGEARRPHVSFDSLIPAGSCAHGGTPIVPAPTLAAGWAGGMAPEAVRRTGGLSHLLLAGGGNMAGVGPFTDVEVFGSFDSLASTTTVDDVGACGFRAYPESPPVSLPLILP
eukprot:NODE_4385_length_1898_cov_3.694523.p1 GENE.NODE_4385_length_1898_cov_3.694523~~NODE_4385_length_1898_cov_3.694523.p1  ORF type:complete len:386 (-),score=97.38 NODE_4385_length_1898_cov_3.694523:176-1333(-)